MNKTVSFTVAVAAGLILALAGCHSGKVASGLASATANPAASQAAAKVQGCISKDGFITAADRQNLITCVAPAGSKAAVETCLQNAVTADNLLVTKADRQKFENTDAPNCVVLNG